MSNKREILFLCILIIAYGVSLLWVFGEPFDEKTNCCLYDFFVFADHQVSEQWFMYISFGYLSEAITIAGAAILFNRYRVHLLLIAVLFSLRYFDYRLFYGEPWFYIHNEPVDYERSIFVIVVLIASHALIKSIKRNGDS